MTTTNTQGKIENMHPTFLDVSIFKNYDGALSTLFQCYWLHNEQKKNLYLFKHHHKNNGFVTSTIN